ncbi:o-succinylbenzoate--CoA ligase [Pseudanabaena sp. UWO310]|uniref:o-succinylbenzoate--CoA ligase n=1 Tax=Pseudanabaena sp. UWO310 TaxID=2480795 RepID=UPI001158D9B6|nr:o-succinylbenzoate--CoA ligase [Pseudanabaena sp. UWO310]TYQ27290.1 o-succinylbenzoate--CoA ligase [Pseudanabaena sp. UWO310]
MKFPNWLSQRAVQKKEAIALSFRDGVNLTASTWTYAQLEEEVNLWVAQLQAWGIRSGDRVGLLLANQPRYITLVHAMTRCEAVAVFLNIRLTAKEINWQIEDSQVGYLLYDEFTRSTIQEFKNLEFENLEFENLEFKNPIEVSYLDISEIDYSSLNSLFRDRCNPLEKRQFGSESINLENLQGIFYTSGTTGKPKGVPLTYGNHFHSAIASVLNLGLQSDDNWLLCMPMFHVGGLAIVWRSAIYGIKLTLLPKFDERDVLEAIASERVTLISLVPTMLTRLLEHSLWQNLQQLRGLLLGGAPASPELIARCQQLNLPIMPTYGMTETASQITTLRTEEIALKQGSSGLPLLGNSLRIVDIDDAQRELPSGEIGQILVQGASVMSGYLQTDRLQAQSQGIADGWLHTGDMGYLDRDGYLYVVSRRSDLIISGGENIYPTEIEAILLSHPAIAEACVVGIVDREWGEFVAAILVTNHNSHQPTLTEIRDFCEQKSLARYKLPKEIYVWKSLPKTASGKLLRQQIRNQINT